MNRKFTLKTQYKKMLADTLTPVSIYLKLRDKFANTLLLESSDYHGNDNTFSYLCFQPIASFEVGDQKLQVQFPGVEKEVIDIQGKNDTVVDHFRNFIKSFEVAPNLFNFPQNGLFGYSSYDAVRYFEDIQIRSFFPDESRKIPDMLYQVYEFVIAINHFKNELYIFQHTLEDQPGGYSLDEVEALISTQNIPSYSFQPEGEESSNMTDELYRSMVNFGIQHCGRGDVFQIVLSRRFSQTFQGDEFNVYRALRSINPSPYLFYFDYGSFKIFGSSPEAQIRIQHKKAEIHPIAGTIKRTGNDLEDTELAKKLAADEKETAEHVMLVDLARNDLSRSGSHVKVETFKEIQYYSHLIHLVSKVTAEIPKDKSNIRLYADTFPAGTLSGAPKYRAMELINDYEPENRGYYGGALGFISFQGDINHAIMIRTFLSKNNRLFYQAGGGIVFKSTPEGELEEVNNKLRALRTAIQMAGEMGAR